MLLGFMVLTGLLSAVVGAAVRRAAGDRAERAEQEKVRALARSVEQDSKSLPKPVDDATVLFKITSEGLTLANHYRLAGVLKAEVDPQQLEAFRAEVLRRSCGNAGTRDRILARGYNVRHNYYDRADELIAVVDVTTASCASVRE